MAKEPYTRGTPGHAPVSGKYYFIHRASRLVRTSDLQTLPIPNNGEWEQVSLAAWEEFRKETKKLSIKEQRKLHGKYACTSLITASPSPKSSSSKVTTPKNKDKPSSPKPVRQSKAASVESKPKSSRKSSTKAAKSQVNAESSAVPTSTILPSKQSFPPPLGLQWD